MWKRFLIQGLLASILSFVACFIYNLIYSKAFYVDFGAVLNLGSMAGACLFGCSLIAGGHFIIYSWKGDKLIGIYNLLVAFLSFSSIISVLSMTLPLEIESPEMFPGLAIPMHFFPAFAYFMIEPFFKKSI